ncbi:MAG: glycosyltransferase family 4 protein [Alphaproteobacteria bacterium]
MNAALHYEVEAFDTSRPKLMGRHAAGESFLRGYARHAAADMLLCYARTRKDFEDFERRVATLGGGSRPCQWITHGDLAGLGRAGCLFHPAPSLADLVWQRRFSSPGAYSLCGVTHTTASENVMDAIGAMMVAPFQPWDAVICTSRAARATIEHIHSRWSAYLAERTGGKAISPVQLPIIPLGVECDEFAASAKSESDRAGLRNRYGIGKDDVAVLFMGRLSYHAKAHPLPLYLGLEEAAARTQKRVHLIQAGWFANESIEKSFVEAAKIFCPGVRALFLDGRELRIRQSIWFAADIFASLSDNIQETFGLTPVEAMAAGLPVVASDWDGYRDTVRDNIDGIMIPTFMPPPGSGDDLAYRHFAGIDNYDHYIGYVSQCAGVDLRAARDAFTALIGDGELRRRMGEAGRKQAREEYDWRVIVTAYQALWADLAERRRREPAMAPRMPEAPSHPLRDDPFSVFSAYPSFALGPDCLAVSMPGVAESDLDHLRSLRMNSYAEQILAPAEEIRSLLSRVIAESPVPISGLINVNTEPLRRAALLRSLGWLGKMGLLRFEPPESP